MSFEHPTFSFAYVEIFFTCRLSLHSPVLQYSTWIILGRFPRFYCIPVPNSIIHSCWSVGVFPWKMLQTAVPVFCHQHRVRYLAYTQQRMKSYTFAHRFGFEDSNPKTCISLFSLQLFFTKGFWSWKMLLCFQIDW